MIEIEAASERMRIGQIPANVDITEQIKCALVKAWLLNNHKELSVEQARVAMLAALLLGDGAAEPDRSDISTTA